ncbi:hypothetical protein G7048_19420 [Diaphorobacter sp. HDW4B]|uniref:lysis system i-spanin subunit Rz n=1 Tax=Diaphorobacter sp. HDW4B TaxID=2714925 RepID=UPI00140B6045|nr:lysis system i-spanin subunit Rz [Diaphorobacter sp. HDW4B]QIL72334.1 hypothetical protein G7048_19420 [Diaphorobacter sp. HDW4B]
MVAQLKVLIAAVLFALGLATGWAVNGWRTGADLADVKRQHAEVLAGIARKTTDAVTAVRKLEQAANTAISIADKSATERIAKNDQENRSLRACVAAGTCGVRIVTRVVRESSSSWAADSSTSSLGDAAVELDREAASRVLDLRESVQLDAEKLDYLQRYAETCHKARSQAAE